MTEHKPRGIGWESFAEQQIRDAQQAGKFDHLPGFGSPIPGIDEPYDENWWVKKKCREENLSLLPPSLQIRIDVEKTLQFVMRLKSEPEVRRALESLNERILRANLASVWGPPSTTMPYDIDLVVTEWRCRQSSSLSNRDPD